MVDRHLDEMGEQRKELERLRAALSKGGGGGGGGGSGGRGHLRNPADIRRIKVREIPSVTGAVGPSCLESPSRPRAFFFFIR